MRPLDLPSRSDKLADGAVRIASLGSPAAHMVSVPAVAVILR